MVQKIIIIGLFILVTNACKKANDTSLPGSVIQTNDLVVSIDENPASNQVLGTIVASSDKGTISFTISSESVSGAFAINSSTGEVTVKDKYLFDYETHSVLTAVIIVGDGISEVKTNVSVNLKDVEHIWTGPRLIFYKSAYADINLEQNQDRITENVWISRGNSAPLINVLGGEGCEPTRVKMAYGTIAGLDTLTFSDCMEKLEGSNLKDLPGKDVVFYLTADDTYIDVHFLTWTSGANGGEFSYERTTP